MLLTRPFFVLLFGYTIVCRLHTVRVFFFRPFRRSRGLANERNMNLNARRARFELFLACK